MKKKKISNYPSAGGSIRTYWGEIATEEDFLKVRIEGVGTFKFFGQLTAETDGDKALISGTLFDKFAKEDKKIVSGELEA